MRFAVVGLLLFHLALASVPVLVTLKHSNAAELEAVFHNVANPNHQLYGRHYSLEKMRQLLGASEPDRVAVTNWLVACGAQNIRIVATHDAYRATVDDLACLDAARPSSVQGVSRADVGVGVRPLHLSKSAGSVLGTPNAQKASYNLPLTERSSNLTNQQMVWGPGTFGFLDSDLSAFYSEFKIDTTTASLTHEGFPGTPGGDNFGEGTLDTSMISSFGLGVHTYVYNSNNTMPPEEGPGFGPVMLDWVSSMNERPDSDMPRVISISLGSLAWESCDLMCRMAVNKGYKYSDCLNYVQYEQRQVCMFPSSDQVGRIDVEFMKLGLRGVTIIGASGDGGSHFSFMRFDTSNALGRALNEISCEYNMPTYPASSPYVLGVGGTQWEGASPNKPIPWTASGGGFSWRSPMPSWQMPAVQQYNKEVGSKLPLSSSYNASNRAYPDVSALADNVPIVLQGQTVPTGGTSASTPTFAGIISLINDHRLNAGLPALGFLAPRLYAEAMQHGNEMFYDMSTGSSACEVENFCCPMTTSFPAAKGWDPITGFGSPLWPGLLKYLGSD